MLVRLLVILKQPYKFWMRHLLLCKRLSSIYCKKDKLYPELFNKMVVSVVLIAIDARHYPSSQIGFDQARFPARSIMVTRIHGELDKRFSDSFPVVIVFPCKVAIDVP